MSLKKEKRIASKKRRHEEVEGPPAEGPTKRSRKQEPTPAPEAPKKKKALKGAAHPEATTDPKANVEAQPKKKKKLRSEAPSAPKKKRQERNLIADAENAASTSAPASSKRPMISLGEKRRGLLSGIEKEESEAEDPDVEVEESKEAPRERPSEVFVDGVPYDWSVDDVRELFSSAGEVADVRCPTWHDSGRLRGYAHIQFADFAGQQNAIKKLHGYYVTEKRFLKVMEANEKDAAAPVATARTAPAGCRVAFVSNLPYDATEPDIANAMGGKKVLGVRIVTSYGRSKGIAYVDFRNTADVTAAVSAVAAGVTLRGRRLRADYEEGAPKAGFHYRKESFASRLGPKKANVAKREAKEAKKATV